MKIVLQYMGMNSTKYGALEKFMVSLMISSPEDYSYYFVYRALPKSNRFIEDVERNGGHILIQDTDNVISFIRLVHKIKPDIINFHFGDKQDVLALLSRIMHVEKVYKTCHCCLYQRGIHISSYSELSIKAKALFLFGISYKLYDSIICVSDYVKSQYEKVFRHTNNAKLVYLGVRPPLDDNILKKIDKINNSEFVISTIAFASDIKGPDVFVNALPYITGNFKAYIIGLDDSLVYTQSLRAQAKRLGIDKKIVWVGITDDVSYYLSQTDIYVQSSRTEALSLAAVEALSYGIPVIASNVGGLPEVTTMLFPSEDVYELAKMLSNLMSSNELRIMLSTDAFQRWKEKFSLETGIKQYIQLYAS